MTQVPNQNLYPSVPTQLRTLYTKLSAQELTHKLLEAIQRQGAEKTWTAIDEIFRLASYACCLSPDQLFEKLGFGKSDFDSANFQAMLGVLRAINILVECGFTDFQPLRPLQNRKEVDFLARRNGNLYAAEVCRSSEDAYRYVSQDDAASSFATWLQKISREVTSG